MITNVREYEPIEVLCNDTLGSLTKARSTSTGETVLLRHLYPQLRLTEEQLQQRERALERLAGLTLPHVARILEVGRSDRSLFFAQEWIEGEPLPDQLTADLPAIDETARLFELLADTVHQLHQQGIIHCHLRLSHVLMTTTGEPILTGFETARCSEEADGEAFAPSGNNDHLRALAPEVLFNQPENVGPATDTYSLGIMLYEMLTGQAPHQPTTTSDLLLRVGFGIVRPPHRLNPDVPLRLSRICRKAMSVAQEQRYPSAALLADDLRLFLQGEPTLADGINLWKRFTDWFRTRFARV